MSRMLIVCVLLCAMMSLTGATSDPGPCWDQKDQGPCRSSYLRWYFNGHSLTCEQFVFGGCHGNRNNFDSQHACAKQCSRFSPNPVAPNPVAPNPVAPIPEPCFDPKDEGPCRLNVRHWYFNAGLAQCERFYYGGCGGNSNNFRSKHACKKQCRRFIKKW